MPRTKARLTIKSSDRVGVVGQPGTGKTVFFKYLITLCDQKSRLIWDPLDQYGGFPDENRIVPEDLNPVQEFDDLCAKLYARGNVTVFVEEAQLYLPESQLLPVNTTKVLNRGRNFGIGLMVCSQRIQEINKRFFDLAQTVVFFRCGMTSQNYIKKLVPKDVANEIFRLKDKEFIYFSLRTEEWNKSTLKFPQDKVPGDDSVTPSSVRMQDVK